MVTGMIRSILGIVITIYACADLVSAEVNLEAGKGILSYTGGEGPGVGKHVVLLAGDEEYRSEETNPMLAKILAEKHGFQTTVLFAIDPDGTVNPTASASLAESATIDSADVLILMFVSVNGMMRRSRDFVLQLIEGCQLLLSGQARMHLIFQRITSSRHFLGIIRVEDLVKKF